MNALRWIVSALLWSATATGAGARVFSLTGSQNPGLLRFDCTSLGLERGAKQAQVGGVNDLCFDETGRLFGISNRALIEFDSESMQILNQQNHNGSIGGIAARGGHLFVLSGTDFGALELIRFNAESLVHQDGTLQSVIDGLGDLAFDENGRLFAVSSGKLREFDSTTLQLINEQTHSGGLAGIAAFGGRVYSLTGISTPVLVTFDADTLLQVGGAALDRVSGLSDLAFDREGRLFGINGQVLVEFDPESLQIIHQASHDSLAGIAAGTLPPPAASIEQISSISMGPGGMQLTMPSAFRRQIGAEYSPDLSPGSWVQLGNFAVVGGVGGVAVFTDPDFVRLSRSAGYYRAFLRPLPP